MAKLVTTKEKYGISVGTRLDSQTAHLIAVKAEALGLSMSKMLGILINRGLNPSVPQCNDYSELIEELESEKQELRQLYKNVMSEFIESISEDSNQTMEFIQKYNQILNALKNE